MDNGHTVGEDTFQKQEVLAKLPKGNRDTAMLTSQMGPWLPIQEVSY